MTELIRLGLLLALLLAAGMRAPLAGPMRADELREPYSCRLLYDEQQKCPVYDERSSHAGAAGGCDRRVLERLRNECLRDGGRP